MPATAIDSASFLRRAWLGADSNYLTEDGWYSALRVPPADGSFRAKQLVQQGKISEAELRRLEAACLDGLRAHAGNEFLDIIEHGGMSHLVTTTRVRDHLSYFVVLQRPEAGGTLSVYQQTIESLQMDTGWGTGFRDDASFDDLPALCIDPPPGSMVLFGGGWRWHRIEPVLGTRPRITYGGFCGPSVDGTELHFWI